MRSDFGSPPDGLRGRRGGAGGRVGVGWGDRGVWGEKGRAAVTGDV